MNLKERQKILSWELTGDLRRLREKAREFQARIVGSHYLIVPETRISDAQAWLAHPPEEDWLIWRARRTAARLKVLPIYLEPGELIVGKPLFSPPARYEKKLKEAEKILATIPPFPGGDAGHFHPDYEKVFQIGLGGLEREILFHLGKTSLPADKKIFYQACHIALKGLMAYVHRTGDACLEMAGRDRKNAPHWRRLGRMCCCLARRPPQTFHEAVQLLFLVTIGLWFGDDHGLTSPGRLDRTLYPFYRKDLRAGRLTPRRAFQLLCALFIQYNCILGPGSAVSAMVAGRDSQGKPICNDLTFLSLAARRATGLIYPTVGLAWHKKIRGDLMDFSLRLLSTGNGDPAFFNDEVIVKGLRDHGVSRSDSFNYMNSTCVEIKVCGASNIWVTAPYFNLPKALLEVLADEKIKPATFPEFCRYLRRNLAEKIIKAAADLDAVWQKRALTGCFPLASCFIADCLKRGLDFDRGGARYQWVENSFVGLANLVDGLLAVKHLIYEKKTISRREFARLLENNFQGREPLRRYLLNHLPHYGTDNETADRLAVEWANFLVSTTEKCRVGPHRYVPGFFCWVIHERFGRETGATPDGRLAGWPLSDGAGGSQGRETKGPTASVLSTTKWDHHKVIGGLVQNLKFSANLLSTEKGRAAVGKVIETYLCRGGFEIQVNVVNAGTLREAQRHPERHRDLLVRVAGYSDYFVHLTPELQAEIIARTEHSLV